MLFWVAYRACKAIQTKVLSIWRALGAFYKETSSKSIPLCWVLEIFSMITHFVAVFFVENDTFNRLQDYHGHQKFLLPWTWKFFFG